MMTTKQTAGTVSRGPAVSLVPSVMTEGGTIEGSRGGRHEDVAEALMATAREEVREGFYATISRIAPLVTVGCEPIHDASLDYKDRCYVRLRGSLSPVVVTPLVRDDSAENAGMCGPPFRNSRCCYVECTLPDRECQAYVSVEESMSIPERLFVVIGKGQRATPTNYRHAPPGLVVLLGLLEDLQMTTTTAETLAEYYGLTHRVIGRQLEGVTHEESLVQPPFRGNCLNWVLGHIIVSRDEALTILGEDLPWDESVASRYQRNSDPITSAEEALPLSQLQALLDESQSRILAGLARLSPERTEEREGEDTDSIGERLTFANWHETYHVGQLELLRQLAGKNDKII